MPLFVPSASIPRKILMAAACVLAFAWFQSPLALAQHSGHVGGGHFSSGGRVAVPHVAAPPASHATIGHAQAAFARRPILIRRRVFLRAPFFWLRQPFYSSWWLNCGAFWDWEYNCDNFLFYEHVPENYVALPAYEAPVYLYPAGQRELVRLYLKDGTVYSVTDYWFVNDQIHFTLPEEEGAESGEQVIGVDELDLQKTIDVNRRRGFRFVRRDEPLDQYLLDHPDANPPLVQVPKN
ncbi:MAG TPA: hypothetical protein VEI73_00210 [Candidatus Acidoferrum sp.]|nr:hypothetical protein [Candidatus Acidoferrum sp.]